jgi:hypothetical protein
MRSLQDADSVFRSVERLASVSVFLSCLELIARPRQLNDQSFMSWPVSRLNRKGLTHGAIAQVLNSLLSYPRILVLIFLRLGFGGFLATRRLNSTQRAGIVTSTALSSIAFTVRSPYGLDGADQMATITFVALMLAHLRRANTRVQKACLWFIALQGCLSYLISGLAKAVSPEWMDGSALPGILRKSFWKLTRY